MLDMYYVSKRTGNYNWLLYKNASPTDVSKKVEALESFNKVYRNSTANEKAFAQTSYLAALVEATWHKLIGQEELNTREKLTHPSYKS